MVEERLQRRLAAILSADVVGYSRLMGVDEAGTLSRLNNLRRELIDPAIAAHSGRIVKLMGDGALVEFASAVDAVTCAIEIQRQVGEHNADCSEADPIRFRIGVNVGDIIIEGEDILGDGVNIAARVEGIAEPGGICISNTAYEQVRDKLKDNFVDLGEQALKNIARPVRVYRLDPTAKDMSEASQPIPAPADRPSIAVLPFQNMSGDPEQEYFCDGLVEDIITTLSKLAGLRVIARNSSFVYKGRSVDVREAAKQLGVRYILEGSVRKSGNRIRITAQLIDAKDGTHVWAERYDRAIDDIFAIQDEITLVLATEMQVRLTEGEQARLHYTTTNNVEAWTYWVQGLSYYREPIDQRELWARRCFVGKRRLHLTRRQRRSTPCSASFTVVDARFGWWDDREAALGKARTTPTVRSNSIRATPSSHWTRCPMLAEGRYDEAVSMPEKPSNWRPARPIWRNSPVSFSRQSGYPEEAVILSKNRSP